MRSPRRAILAALAIGSLVAAASPQEVSSASAIQVAQVVGLPPVDPTGAVAGPFDGPEGTIYYLGKDALVTFYHPTQYLAYFGQVTEAGIAYSYGLTALGQYVFDGAGQAQQVAVLPDDVYRWPHANAVAQVLIQYLLAVQQGRLAMPQEMVDLGGLSTASRMLHDTNMAIIGNMGSPGCTEYYDGVYYLGCW